MEGFLAEETPKVTVVVPVRNEEANIGRCLKALLSQDYPGEKLEIIVVDGMSTDGSVDIMNAIVERNETLRARQLAAMQEERTEPAKGAEAEPGTEGGTRATVRAGIERGAMETAPATESNSAAPAPEPAPAPGDDSSVEA
ncbi:MAG: glycosyltransferase, partial [Candidatus Eisenbacteria bacterium]